MPARRPLLALALAVLTAGCQRERSAQLEGSARALHAELEEARDVVEHWERFQGDVKRLDATVDEFRLGSPVPELLRELVAAHATRQVGPLDEVPGTYAVVEMTDVDGLDQLQALCDGVRSVGGVVLAAGFRGNESVVRAGLVNRVTTRLPILSRPPRGSLPPIDPMPPRESMDPLGLWTLKSLELHVAALRKWQAQLDQQAPGVNEARSAYLRRKSEVERAIDAREQLSRAGSTSLANDLIEVFGASVDVPEQLLSWEPTGDFVVTGKPADGPDVQALKARLRRRFELQEEAGAQGSFRVILRRRDPRGN